MEENMIYAQGQQWWDIIKYIYCIYVFPFHVTLDLDWILETL